MTTEQRRLAGVLADIIIPADDQSPSATQVGVVDFLDEWISAPYPDYRQDRKLLLAGFDWLDSEARRRTEKLFVELDDVTRRAMCDAICNERTAIPKFRKAARFFARFRDLTAGGFYTTAAGRKDLGYIGNVPLTRFLGPPRALLEKLGLTVKA